MDWTLGPNILPQTHNTVQCQGFGFDRGCFMQTGKSEAGFAGIDRTNDLETVFIASECIYEPL